MSARKSAAGSAGRPIYVVSGGTGASGRQVVDTALAQFDTLQLPVIVRSRVRSLRQLAAVVDEAARDGGTVVHTLVDGALRKALIRLGRERRVVTIDLMGPLLDRVARQTGASPLEQPGLYRKLRQDYFDRVEAIEFAVAHDDGNRPADIPLADVVIVGVSRCGKTPLCMYLAVHGLKAANVPIVKGVPLPDPLFRTDRRRVIGLSIEHNRLVEYRMQRQERLGRLRRAAYASPGSVFEELEAADKICREYGFRVVDATDKPIEMIAGEIVKLLAPAAGRTQRGPVPQ